MNTLKKMRGYFYMTDLLFSLALMMTLGVIGLLVAVIITDASKEWKPGVVAQKSIECLPAVEAVETTETTEGVAEQGPYTCTITAKMDDQYTRDLFEANGYLQALEYGQHRIGDPYPEVPGEETDADGKVVVDGEISKRGVTITFVTEGEKKE